MGKVTIDKPTLITGTNGKIAAVIGKKDNCPFAVLFRLSKKISITVFEVSLME